MKNFSFLFLLLAACSHHSPKTVKTVDVNAIPEWVTELDKYCPESELCATGEGDRFLYADINAKKSLAGIFGTKITGKTQHTLSSFQDDVKSLLNEETKIDVQEEIDDVLEGAEIVERARYKNIFFSLVKIPKKTILSLINERLANIQTELKELLAKKERGTFFKIQELINQEKDFIDRLIIINPNKPVRSHYKRWVALHNKLSRKNMCTATIGSFQSLDKFLTASLSSIGHKVFPGDDRCDYLLRAKIQTKKEYIKVKGFQKMSVQAFLEFLSRSGETIGSVELKEMQTGRSYIAIEANVLKKMRKDIIKNFHQLNIP